VDSLEPDLDGAKTSALVSVLAQDSRDVSVAAELPPDVASKAQALVDFVASAEPSRREALVEAATNSLLRNWRP
jgi:hypothetical protein